MSFRNLPANRRKLLALQPLGRPTVYKVSKMNQHRIVVKGIVACVFFLASIAATWGQVEVTPTFRFKDGIYLSFEEFQKNAPSLSWNSFVKRSATNPQTLITQVEYIRYKNSQEALDVNKIWGICMDGLPFIRLEKDSISKELTSFAGLRLAGNICYYSYENRVDKDYEISAYNPLNGEPFRRATISRTVTVFKEKIFSFEGGLVEDFSVPNLSKYMQDDPEILQLMQQLNPRGDEFQEKLFRLLISYNRRHPTFFKE